MTDFASFCAEHGLRVERPIPDGRIHRVKTEDKRQHRNGAYKFTGEWGWVQNWATMIAPAIWRAAAPVRATSNLARVVVRDALDADREQHARAAKRAAEIVGACQYMTHPYLERKGFPRQGGLVDAEGRLVVPMRWFRDTRRIQSVQWILPNGEKRFLTGGAAGEAVFVLGPANAPETWICEGLATGLSIEAALKVLHRPARVMVAFSAGNIVKVAPQLQGRVFVVADHDRENPQTGKRAGTEAAIASGHPWVMPEEEGTDANDLHVARGLYALVALLRGAMK